MQAGVKNPSYTKFSRFWGQNALLKMAVHEDSLLIHGTLVGLSIIMAPVFVFINTVLLIKFGHPDDKNESFVAKLLVVLR